MVYATGQGTTKEVAEVIGKGLESSDTVVEVVAIGHRVPDLSGFDTVVLGSPVYHEALLKSFVVFACQRLEQLAKPDVWLFGIGMAPALTGPVGRRVARAVPKEIAIVRDALAYAATGHSRDATSAPGSQYAPGCATSCWADGATATCGTGTPSPRGPRRSPRIPRAGP
ncbi:flavodoxin domain-containing protein [Nocardia sp. NPDC005746]|uniref:flavodoxin domain-containing protein n=1 Tax=Nocardia sp. NPDC005746 TaxID=3157062 RepID=UPI0033D1061E